MSQPTRALHSIGEEVSTLQTKIEETLKAAKRSKIEHRDLCREIAVKVKDLTDGELGYVSNVAKIEVSRLKDYVFCYKQWPDGTFPADATYTVLEELARDPERFQKIKSGMSKRDARAAKGGKVDTPSRWSDDTKADFIKDALDNPDIARKIAESVAARAAIAEARLDLENEHRAKAEAANPARQKMRKQTEKDRVLLRLDNIRYALIKAMNAVMDQGLSGDVDVAQALNEITLVHDGFLDYLSNGTTDFDAALSALLEENS